MRSGDMSHGRAPAFDDHLDHSMILFEKEQRRSLAGMREFGGTLRPAYRYECVANKNAQNAPRR